MGRVRTKTVKRSARRTKPDDDGKTGQQRRVARTTRFGQHVVRECSVIGKRAKGEGRRGGRLLYDMFSAWLWIYLLIGRHAHTAKDCMLDFSGPHQYLFGFLFR